MKDILIVVDMQNDFIDGSLGSSEAQAIVPVVKKKIEQYMLYNENRIFYTMDTHFDINHRAPISENRFKIYEESVEGKHLPVPHCIINTHGWEIPKELIPMESPSKIMKYTFGVSDWSLEHELDELITKISMEKKYFPVEIELCGLCTDICVVSNALSLKSWLENAAEIYVDPSACAGTSKEAHEAALTVMKSCHVNIMK